METEMEPVFVPTASSLVDKADNLKYDIGNLMAFDSAEIDQSDFGSGPEEFLKNLSRENAQLLINKIFSLETEPLPPNLGVGRLAVLPPCTTPLPREKHVPKPKPPTKWEQFAKTKGIQKRKRSKLVWDENTQDWKRRWGYDKANDESKQWVVEAKANDDGSVDPWTRMKQEKKERMAKNKSQQERNLKVAKGPQLPGTIDLTSAAAAKPMKRKQQKVKEKSHVDVALGIAQHSTASMGKFDPTRKNEPIRKDPTATKKTKKASAAPVDIKSEKGKSLSVLDRVMKSSEKAEGSRFNYEKAANAQRAQQQKEGKGKGKKGKRGAGGGGGDDDDGGDAARKAKKAKKAKVQQVARFAKGKKGKGVMKKKRHQ